MAITVQQIHPVAHLPLVLGVLRRLEVATLIDGLILPHPAHGLSCGRGVEALVLAILDGHHALYKVGKRLEERGMVTLLQPGLTRAALNAYRLGHILDALFAANLNQVLSAIALTALEVYAIPTPWLPQDRGTRTIDAESPDFMRVQNQYVREIGSLLLQYNQALAALLSRRGPWVPLHSHRRLA